MTKPSDLEDLLDVRSEQLASAAQGSGVGFGEQYAGLDLLQILQVDRAGADAAVVKPGIVAISSSSAG